MAEYTWDLGFNFDSLPDPDNDGNPYLLNGSVQFPSSGPSPGPSRFQVGDFVSFNLYNRTPNAIQTAYVVDGGLITFRSGDRLNTSTSPLAQNSIPIAAMRSNGFGSSVSIATASNVPAWLPLVPKQEIMNNGEFYFTILLYVQGPSSRITFRVDPEMIVGGTND